MYALGTIHNDACVVGNMIPSSQSWRENSDVNWAPHTGLETRALGTRISFFYRVCGHTIAHCNYYNFVYINAECKTI